MFIEADISLADNNMGEGNVQCLMENWSLDIIMTLWLAEVPNLII
jgi:hypothetical protein